VRVGVTGRQITNRTIQYSIIIILIVAIGIISIQYSRTPPIMNDYSFNMDLLYTVNYTGLPDGVDVKVYPKNHIINGDTFKIVYKNNRNENLYWGSEWVAEKWVNGTWFKQDPPWDAWTAELRLAGPFFPRVDTEKAFFGKGVYRITKKCMLTDNYSRERREWVDEFTVQFILIKTE